MVRVMVFRRGGRATHSTQRQKRQSAQHNTHPLACSTSFWGGLSKTVVRGRVHHKHKTLQTIKLAEGAAVAVDLGEVEIEECVGDREACLDGSQNHGIASLGQQTHVTG